MAEIKIEKKKPVWPWILVILLIIIGVYLYWSYNENVADRNNEETEIITDTIRDTDENIYESPVDTATLEIDSTTIAQ